MANRHVIPFYGATQPELFAIERAAMDRPGKVLEVLDRLMPSGLVLDVGAGDGYSADRLDRPDRPVVALEPSEGMRRPARPLLWVGGVAQAMPFAPSTFAGAYATWAYFFSREWDPGLGVDELHRVVRRGGPVVIVDNAGDDEFSALAPSDISADPGYWVRQGFERTVVDTVFAFTSLDEARTLLHAYFGDRAPAEPKLTWSYRVALFTAASRGER